MKIFYQAWNPQAQAIDTVDKAEDIIGEYEAQGYTLTLRQLYYQFVARGLIENTERSYKNLGNTITRARMAGLISWDAIEDRNREHSKPWYDENIMNPLEALPRYIRFDRWARQDTYVEVWVEKEALGNVIERACQPLLVPHMACKGYLSASEAWRAGQRFLEKFEEGKQCVLIHLGDHDPSGIDMTRDNQDRVELFSKAADFGECVDVRRIALNIDQVREYDPPPNPTKITDSRARGYIKKFGRTSWELDAVEPHVMLDLIKTEVEQYIDWAVWEEVGEEQEDEREKLRKVYENWDQIQTFLR